MSKGGIGQEDSTEKGLMKIESPDDTDGKSLLHYYFANKYNGKNESAPSSSSERNSVLKKIDFDQITEKCIMLPSTSKKGSEMNRGSILSSSIQDSTVKEYQVNRRSLGFSKGEREQSAQFTVERDSIRSNLGVQELKKEVSGDKPQIEEKVKGEHEILIMKQKLLPSDQLPKLRLDLLGNSKYSENEEKDVPQPEQQEGKYSVQFTQKLTKHNHH